ncbi:secreted protein [gut metagenome]|uniref:Secreted protein n=1 Tax=gut metagenome TaxID=749906 RepID=J9G069_9ZZZZ
MYLGFSILTRPLISVSSASSFSFSARTSWRMSAIL